MPHLLIRGLSVDQVRSISRPLVDELAQLCQCPADHMLLECLHTTTVFDGQVVPSYPFVEVAWFERGPDIRRNFARIVDHHIRSLGIAESDIAFRTYREDAYYMDGEPVAAPIAAATDADALRQQVQSLREDNARLRDQLQRARKSAAFGADSNMSSKLRDALRE